MLEKIIVLLIMYTLAFSTDVKILRDAMVRGKRLYFGIMFFTLYLSADYIMKAELPDLHSIIDIVFTKPSRMIVEYLTVKPT
ncbi:hypothetical protein KZ483_11845 [Paenibacillus sp. sptzw28]|uniref:hypothetical protein n=1 Tax=Paenibacillus sp. sptzw28 TaxID=715179 RepID=UPI001C6DDD02|nr:hypothetical protein [Paenibacillus sp. sptzw28]QYR23540.1 hypothetical protein KZ483_11845 [Paenibacillus sp. sptzw28]